MSEDFVRRILSANIYDLVRETPLDAMPRLSARLGGNILIKREDQQAVFSFKLRGAYNKLRKLSKLEREAGVIAASAGNHAQGMAMASAHLKIPAIIVMPQTTPAIKVDAVRARGAEVRLYGDTFDEAGQEAQRLAEAEGYCYVHPFDDEDVIAGQGTIAVELCRQLPEDCNALFVPVGGGGLIAGIAVYMKFMRPKLKIIGVEAEDSACMKAALEAGHVTRLKHVGIFADGVAVAQAGKKTFALAQKYVDEIITVSTDEMCAAVKDIFEDTRVICEAAGALSLAGCKRYFDGKSGYKAAVIASGANINFDRLRHISERTEIGERREALLAVQIPERHGSFSAFCDTLGKRNITEFNYRRHDDYSAQVFVGIELAKGHEGLAALIYDLEDSNYVVTDLSRDEMSKVHIRHLVGGHASGNRDERIFRFIFPERPGALRQFLDALGSRWSISLFHYRNHGSAYGRVLAGLLVPDSERDDFSAALEKLGYDCTEETENPAYQAFLK